GDRVGTTLQLNTILVQDRAVKFVSYFRTIPSHGVAEVGHVYNFFEMAKTRSATESIDLLVCDSCNLQLAGCCWSLGAHVVYKGRNYDSMWFPMVDCDWNGGSTPNLIKLDECWLDSSSLARTQNCSVQKLVGTDHRT
ncbi:putative GNAT family acetyltransferase, partial [Phytophthora infestans]